MLNLNVKEFAEAIAQEGVTILDVRTPEEFAEGFIEGARNIDFYRDDFEIEINSLDKESSYALYCRSGKRSGQAAQMMQEAGFLSVSNLDGGMIDWANAGMPRVNN
jgi:rhodanese-related sulfurtransferase